LAPEVKRESAASTGWQRDRAWVAAGMILLAGHVISFGFFEIDDAYISFRYARNLLDGHGLVFNPGDPVEGYSNLLWVLLSAAGMAGGLPPLIWARILGLGSALLIIAFTPAMIRRLHPRAGWVAGAGALLMACCGPLACWSFSGLETVFFAALAVWAWFAVLGGRSLEVGIASLLLALTRPDGLALGAAFVLWSWLPSRGVGPGVGGAAREIKGDVATGTGTGQAGWQRWAGPLLFGSGVLAHFLWRHATYGEWLPNTYFAKTGDLMGQLRTGLPYGVDFLRTYLVPWFVVGLWASWVSQAQTLRSTALVRTLMLCGLWFLYAVIIGGDMLGMFRFFVPILPLLIAAGTALLSLALGQNALTSQRRAAGIVVLILALISLLPSTVGKERRLISAHMSLMNLGGWKLAGDTLAAHFPAGTTIALGPAGYIPFRTGFKAFDLLGVTDRHIAHKQMPFTQGYAGHEKHDGPYILSQRPDYLLLGNVDVTSQPRQSLIPPFSREVDILTHPVFQRDYEQVVIPLDAGRYLNCFKRRDVPLPIGERSH